MGTLDQALGALKEHYGAFDNIKLMLGASDGQIETVARELLEIAQEATPPISNFAESALKVDRIDL